MDQKRHWIDQRFYERAVWCLKFSLLPRRCDQSGELIWLEQAYVGVQIVTGPGEPVFEYRWVKKNEWLLGKLRGTL
jgi:hypothetical protein